jgi:hypothetical protein
VKEGAAQAAAEVPQGTPSSRFGNTENKIGPALFYGKKLLHIFGPVAEVVV